MYIAALSANKFSLLLFISEVLAPGQTSLKRFILVAQVLIGCYLVRRDCCLVEAVQFD